MSWESQFKNGSGLVWVDDPPPPLASGVAGYQNPQFRNGSGMVYREGQDDRFVVDEPDPLPTTTLAATPQPPARSSGFSMEAAAAPQPAPQKSPWLGAPSGIPKFPDLRDRPQYRPSERRSLGALWEEALAKNPAQGIDRKRLLMQFGLGMLGAGTGKAFFQALGEAGQGTFNYRDKVEAANKEEALRNALRQYQMDAEQQDIERKDYDAAFGHDVDSAQWSNKELIERWKSLFPDIKSIGNRDYEFIPGQSPRALYEAPEAPHRSNDSRFGQAEAMHLKYKNEFPTIQKALDALYPRGSAQSNAYSLEALRSQQGALDEYGGG